MITELSQLDLSKTYSYADYLTWKLKERIELIKGKLRRTRYFCREAKTGKLYLVAKNAQVTPLETNEL